MESHELLLSPSAGVQGELLQRPEEAFQLPKVLEGHRQLRDVSTDRRIAVVGGPFGQQAIAGRPIHWGRCWRRLWM